MILCNKCDLGADWGFAAPGEDHPGAAQQISVLNELPADEGEQRVACFKLAITSRRMQVSFLHAKGSAVEIQCRRNVLDEEARSPECKLSHA